MFLSQFPLTFFQTHYGMSLFIVQLIDYSHVNWHDLHDHSTDSPWEDILRVGASVAAAEFYGLVQVRIDVCIPQHKYLIS